MASHLWIPILFANMIALINGSHFRGGIITWRALNTTPSGTTAQILVHQRYAWRRSAFSPVCTAATISSTTLISSGTGTMTCFTGGSCGSFANAPADVYCTDFSATTDYSMGERYTTYTLPLNRKFIIGFFSSAWLGLAIKGGGNWQLTNQIELTVRPDGVINTSPVTSTLPVFYRTVNVQHVHVIQMSDADTTDTLRCRWSTNNSPVNVNNYDECGSVCSPTLNNFTLIAENCTLIYKITSVGGYYAVALQIEDFYTVSSTIALSSVPVQFLFYGVSPPTGCSIAPSIIGVRPNLACIGIQVGSLANETVIAQVGCPGKTIPEFVTSAPTGLIKTAILNPSTGIYTINLLFTPTINQFGPQGFCAGALDNTNVQSEPWCITFLVGFTAPNLQTPVLVQGSASPIGTIFANQSIFSIQSQNGVAVNRPGHNGTYVSFNDATLGNVVVLQYDCGWSPNVIYTGSTIIVYAPYAWVPGHRYYVTFDSGASSGNDFCHAESAPITNPAFWQFDIWNPGLSSTTSTTTTPPTTHTGVTRGPSTTTPVPGMTTTGVVVATSTTMTTTTATTSITLMISTGTAGTNAPTTTTAGEIHVMSPKDFEEACKQPVIVASVVSMVLMIPVNFVGMFALFTKMEKMFNPNRLMAIERQRKHRDRIVKKY